MEWFGMSTKYIRYGLSVNNKMDISGQTSNPLAGVQSHLGANSLSNTS